MFSYFWEEHNGFVKLIISFFAICFLSSGMFYFGLETEKSNILDICYCPSCRL